MYKIIKVNFTCTIIVFLPASLVLTGCMAINALDSGASLQTLTASNAESASVNSCPVTEPVWATPPEDDAVQGTPAPGHYYLNQDRSIWASAWWVGGENPLRVSEDGVKVGWFRPAGATLDITGRRIDGQAPPLEAHVPCCYPTRFQSTGLYFPTQGCWEITAKAAASVLTFVVWVEPGF
jgi:hypothetical protein